MALSAFDEPAHQPTADDLARVLGPAAPLWAALVAEVRGRVDDVAETWGFAGPKFGWSMRLVHGSRNLCYMTPRAGQLLVGMALGDKAIANAESAGMVSPRALATARAAPKYAEGRGVRIPVASAEDLGLAVELARIKIGR